MNEREGVLSCSELPRVAACPASAALCDGLPESPATDWSADGEKIHACCIASLTKGAALLIDDGDADQVRRGEAFAAKCRQLAAKVFEDEPFEWHCEQREWLWDDQMTRRLLTGRWDCVAVSRHLRRALVIDLKTGPRAQFSVAPALRNLQLAGYALLVGEAFDAQEVWGAILTSEHDDADPVIIPHGRIVHADSRGGVEYSEVWNVIQAAAEARKLPWHASRLHPGEHCTYCPAKAQGVCPAYRDALAQVLSLADFQQSLSTVDGPTLARAKDAGDLAKKLAGLIDDELMRRINATGQPVGEWTTGTTRAQRQVTDAFALAQKLVTLGAAPSAITAELQLPVGKAEELYAAAAQLPPTSKKTKAAFAAFAGPLVQPTGGGNRKLVRLTNHTNEEPAETQT